MLEARQWRQINDTVFYNGEYKILTELMYVKVIEIVNDTMKNITRYLLRGVHSLAEVIIHT